MARNKKRSAEYTASPLGRSLSMPGVFLIRMLLFLALVGFIAAILFPQFEEAFQANPGLNGLIIAVLGIGALGLSLTGDLRMAVIVLPSIRARISPVAWSPSATRPSIPSPWARCG